MDFTSITDIELPGNADRINLEDSKREKNKKYLFDIWHEQLIDGGGRESLLIQDDEKKLIQCLLLNTKSVQKDLGKCII